ncbi:MAG: hypothetical protein M3167_17900 [Acidobacteriota bacterium]|nr:hypothetical protein [Acidobacteriota bacterium]
MKLACRSGRVAFALTLLAIVAGPSAGCGRKAKAARHHGEEAPPVAAPTPDNTPIPVLRTPAGLVLKLEESGPPTPTPSAATPSPTPPR